jgi:hypothetical protein
LKLYPQWNKQKKVIDGKTAFIDPRYRERSFIERNLVEIMEKCWVYEPEDRIDIFEVIRLLREVDAENEKLEKQAKG